ncbi:Uncharacterised protein [Sphingobacterium multivorum]|uniref:Uncharacterized protein n=1 Tax=Sphingobacterium multivorum TaxID=28454 RepID=A0A2X2JRS1_SPHMU|nr:Uncharacterised protein [Sphingobacterium multivorum]
MSQSVKFSNVNTLFSKTLKQKINNYFQNSLQPRTGNGKIYLKASILLISFAVLYLLLVFAPLHWSIFNSIMYHFRS